MSKIQQTVHQIVREEMVRLVKEVKEKSPKIHEDLEALRKKLIPEMTNENGLKIAPAHEPCERKVPINTVAELLDVKVNELMLHFLNNVKATNERHMVEYRLGNVVFRNK